MYGKILLISECGQFAAIKAENYVAGVRHRDRLATPKECIDDAVNAHNRGNIFSISYVQPSYFVGVNIGDLLEKAPEMFDELLKQFEKMQQNDRAEFRITNPGAMKVARMAWASHLAIKGKAAAAIVAAEKQVLREATNNLFDPDID